MQLGISLSLTEGGGALDPIAPLFAGGAQGLRLDNLSNFGKQWQDSAGTTPVTAVEQPDGLVLDTSGRGNHLTQATAAARPLIRNAGGGGQYYLNFDGVDDSLSSATGGGGTTGFFFCAAIELAAAPGAGQFTLFSDQGTNAGFVVQIVSGSAVTLFAGNGTAFDAATTAGTVAVATKTLVTAWQEGATIKVQIDSGAIASAAHATHAAGTAGITVGKDNGAATRFINGKVYAGVYRYGVDVTASERATIQAYVRAQAGL